MTDKQPKALRLANHLERFRSFPDDLAAAAELRRLHEVNAELVEALKYVIKGVPSTWVGVVKAQTILEKTKEEKIKRKERTMTEPLLYRFFRWLCDKTGHVWYHGWIYDGYYHRDCKICGRIMSEPVKENK